MAHTVIPLHRPLVLRALDAVAEAWRRAARVLQAPPRIDPADERLMRDIGLGEFAVPPSWQRDGGGWTSGGWKA